MPKALLIAEKPDLMRKIKEVYDRYKSEVPYDIDFESQRGHLLTLKTPDKLDEELKAYSWDTLPIEPEKYGGFQYEVIKEKKQGNFLTAQERFDQIKKKINSGKYDCVINAGDPDQEGELLIRIVLEEIGCRLPILRFWTNDLTDAHILKALKNMRDDENDPMLVQLLDAAYCRQHSDYRVGMNISRAASMKAGGKVAAGRVKTPTLGIVVRRENEIKNFKPKTLYGVKAAYEEGFEGTLFVLSESHEKDEDEGSVSGAVWFETKKEAEDVIARLEKEAVVTKYEVTREKSYAPKLFKLASAQREAGKIGYSAAATQKIIQALYEKKIISYPRTGCEYIHSDEDFNAMLRSASKVPYLAPFVKEITREDIERVKKTKTWVNDKAANDEGHTALVPTTEPPSWEALSKEEKDIYLLIVRQFVAIFLPPLIQDKMVLISEISEKAFKSTGKNLVDPGYTRIFERKFTGEPIPPHKEGDMLVVREFKCAEKTSVCPKRYTSPELVAAMENPVKFLEDESLKKLGKKLKIGTPATRSGIIEELIRNGYMEAKKEGKREVLVPTEAGMIIIKNLESTAICKVDMTGDWEEKLEAVRKGELKKDDFEGQMRQGVRSLVEEIKNLEMEKIPSAKGREYMHIGECPYCGGKIMRGPSRFYCTGYKEGCELGGFIERNGTSLTNEEFLSLIEGKGDITKTMTKGSLAWQQKIVVNSKGKIQYPSEEKDMNLSCPKCGKRMLETAVGYTCEGRKEKTCDIYVGKIIGGKQITVEQAEKLFTTGKTDVIKGFFSEKKKRLYDAYLQYSEEEKKVVMRASAASQETKHHCPICGRTLLKQGARLVCSGGEDNSCGFKMFAVAFGKELSEESIEDLIGKVSSGAVSGGEHAYITNGEVGFGEKCPICGEEVKRDGMHFTCACGLDFYRTVASHVLIDSEVRTLLSGGNTEEIHDFIKKDGGKFSATLKLNKETKKIGMAFSKGRKEETEYTCPICKEKKLLKSGDRVGCECGFSAWTTVSKVPISKENLDLLFEKGETDYIKMKSKAGKPFEAKIAIDYDNLGTRFVF